MDCDTCQLCNNWAASPENLRTPCATTMRLIRLISGIVFTQDTRHWSDCMDRQAGLLLCCLHASKSGFLALRPICYHMITVKLQWFKHQWNIYYVWLIACWLIVHVFFVVCRFFQNQFFQKILSGMPSVCQTVWIQIRPDILSGLIWVQTVCKGYQQMTLSRQWVNSTSLFSPPKIVFIGPDIIILKMA